MADLVFVCAIIIFILIFGLHFHIMKSDTEYYKKQYFIVADLNKELVALNQKSIDKLIEYENLLHKLTSKPPNKFTN